MAGVSAWQTAAAALQQSHSTGREVALNEYQATGEVLVEAWFHRQLYELFKIIKKLVGHDIKGISRTGPQNTESDAVVSVLDLTHQG